MSSTSSASDRRRSAGARRVFTFLPRVFADTFRRPVSQVGLGILAGSALIGTAATLAPGTNFAWAEGLSGAPSLAQLAMLLAYATLMLGV